MGFQPNSPIIGPGPFNPRSRRAAAGGGADFGDAEPYSEYDYTHTHVLDADAGPRQLSQRESWNFNNVMTVEFWVMPKTNFTTGTRYVVGARGTPGSYGPTVAISAAYDPPRPYISIRDAAGTRTDCMGTDGPSLPTGTWVHYAVALADGNTRTVNQWFVNGSPITTTNPSFDFTSRNAQDYPPWYIGGAYAFTGGYDLYLAIVRTWLRPLSDAEIAANWNKIVHPGAYGLHTQHTLDNDDSSLCYHNHAPLTGAGGVYVLSSGLPTAFPTVKQQVYDRRVSGGYSEQTFEIDPEDYANGTYDNFNDLDDRLWSNPWNPNTGQVIVQGSVGSKEFKIVPSADANWQDCVIYPNPDHADYPFDMPAWGGMYVLWQGYDRNSGEYPVYVDIGARSNSPTAGNYVARQNSGGFYTWKPYSSGGSWQAMQSISVSKQNTWHNYAVGIGNPVPSGTWSSGLFGDLELYHWNWDAGNLVLPGAPTNSWTLLGNAISNRWRVGFGGGDRHPSWDSDGDNEWPWEYNQYRNFPLNLRGQCRNSNYVLIRKVKWIYPAYTP